MILRGNDRKDIFIDDKARYGFLDLLSEGTSRFGYRVHAFCLMSNHVHLAVQAGEEPISKAIQNVGFRHALRTNWKAGSSGHIFQGRFKALLVDDFRYAMQLVRYIDRNPVEAGLVEDPGRWHWSSHRAYLGTASWKFLTTSWILDMLADEPAAARRRYLELVLADDSPRGEVDGRLEELLGGSGRDGLKKSRPAVQLSLEEIVLRVSLDFGLTPERLLSPDRSRHVADVRAVILHVALRLQAASVVDVARALGRERSVLSHGLLRLQSRMELEPALSCRIDALVKTLGSDPACLSVTIRG